MTLTGWLLAVGIAGVFALAPAEIARRKGYDFTTWWLLGLLAWVIVLPIAVLMPRSGSQRQCPHCTEWISISASACPRCGHDVSPVGSTSRVDLRTAKAVAWFGTGAVLVGFAAIIYTAKAT